MRIRALREKEKDTLAAETEQSVAGEKAFPRVAVPLESAALLRPYKGMEKSGDGSSGSCAEILIGGVFGLGAEPIVEGVRDVEDDLCVLLG